MKGDSWIIKKHRQFLKFWSRKVTNWKKQEMPLLRAGKYGAILFISMYAAPFVLLALYLNNMPVFYTCLTVISLWAIVFEWWGLFPLLRILFGKLEQYGKTDTVDVS